MKNVLLNLTSLKTLTTKNSVEKQSKINNLPKDSWMKTNKKIRPHPLKLYVKLSLKKTTSSLSVLKV